MIKKRKPSQTATELTTASGRVGAGAAGALLLLLSLLWRESDDSRERCWAAAAAVRGDAASLASLSLSGRAGSAGRGAGLARARLSGVSRASVSTEEHRSNDACGRARRFLTLNIWPTARVPSLTETFFSAMLCFLFRFLSLKKKKRSFGCGGFLREGMTATAKVTGLSSLRHSLFSCYSLSLTAMSLFFFFSLCVLIPVGCV